jgi:RNA polymerase sigma factor (TIGR02999 family)
MTPDTAGPGPVTLLLERWMGGDSAAFDEVLPLVYDELRRLARHMMAGERSDHTLQATALVHEAYARLIDRDHPTWRGRAHFFAVAALVMRRVLVDHARRRGAWRRGGAVVHVALDVADGAGASADQGDLDLVALDQALERLAAAEPRIARIVELRFFGGLSVAECAGVLELSTATVGRDWRFARAWLQRELERSDDHR